MQQEHALVEVVLELDARDGDGHEVDRVHNEQREERRKRQRRGDALDG